jgi:hypothetical protein
MNLFKKSDMASLPDDKMAMLIEFIRLTSLQITSQNKNFQCPLQIKYYIIGIHKQPEHK